MSAAPASLGLFLSAIGGERGGGVGLRRFMESADLRAEWRLLELAEASGLASRLKNLPPSAATRIARSPLFLAFAAPDNPEPWSSDLLAEWLTAEEILLDHRTAEAPIWTAMGDAHLDGGGYFAPRVLGMILDVRSPLVLRAPFLPASERSAPRLAADPDGATADLTRAAAIVATTDVASLDLIVCALRVLICYDLASRDSFSSISSRRFPGLAAFVNLGALANDPCLLADALLHEAIHSCLYAIEADVPFYRGNRFYPATLSPWTGATLPLHSFVHATLVWFALLRFWALAVVDPDRSDPMREALFLKARHGFTGDSLPNALRTVRDHVTPAVRDALEVVRMEARNYID
jgi:HEXXH motif-containing protein